MKRIEDEDFSDILLNIAVAHNRIGVPHIALTAADLQEVATALRGKKGTLGALQKWFAAAAAWERKHELVA